MTSDDLTSMTAKKEDERVHPDVLRTLNDVLRGVLTNVGRMEDVEEAESLANESEPGEWRVRNGRVTRYDGSPVVSDASLRFMAKSRDLVPTLVRIVFALRDALIAQIALGKFRLHNMELARDALAHHREEIASGVETGPEHEARVLVEMTRLGIWEDVQIVAGYWKRWLAGHSVEAELLPYVKTARDALAERREAEANNRAEFEQMKSEAHRLLVELRAGRIPPEFEQKKRKK